MSALLALLEKSYDSVLLLSFDTHLLEHPIGAISDILCRIEQPRPSMLFDRPTNLAQGAPDHSSLRFLRGLSGQALIRNFVLESEANPFLRPLMSLAHMVYHPTEDYAVPPLWFADLDGFPDLDRALSLSTSSTWVSSLYRPLRLGSAPRRALELRRLCAQRLLPHCLVEGRSGPGESLQELLRASAEAPSNASWGRQWAALFQWLPGEIPRLRPRVFQVGPSSAATTAIRDFMTRHGLRTVKSYHQDLYLMEWIDRALDEGKPALFYVDQYDAYTDFLYPFLSRIPWCSEGCKTQSDNVTEKIGRYLHIVGKLAEHYPYSKFVFNTRRDFPRWLASQMYNCWPWLEKKTMWAQYLEQYEFCCGPNTGPLGNGVCWADPALRIFKAPEHQPHEEWAHQVCCKSLPTFRYIWKAMHQGVKRMFIGEPERVLFFPIEGSSKPLSDFLGVRHRPDAWRKAHAG
mmetsp:Transcript_135184/g.432098  ORF Transcript_135184/g.432098 Transcript_135184/m.432098 type:complete len:460 (+) Transcript_135184:259-1638(+)